MRLFISSLLCFLTGCSTTPIAIDPVKAVHAGSGTNDIYVIGHSWHTGIAFKAEDLNNLIPALAVRFPRKNYYEIGWGDADFYQAEEGDKGHAPRALFWSSGSVVHVVGFDAEPEIYYRYCDVRRIKVSHENYLNMLKFIKSSFLIDEKGNPAPRKLGTQGDSQFYAATGNYYILNTCNKWTAKALYSAGLDIGTSFKFTTASIMGYLDDESLSRKVGQGIPELAP